MYQRSWQFQRVPIKTLWWEIEREPHRIFKALKPTRCEISHQSLQEDVCCQGRRQEFMLHFKPPWAQPDQSGSRSCLCEQILTGHTVDRNTRLSWRHLKSDLAPLSLVGNLLVRMLQTCVMRAGGCRRTVRLGPCALVLGPQTHSACIEKMSEIKNWEEDRMRQKMVLNWKKVC